MDPGTSPLLKEQILNPLIYSSRSSAFHREVRGFGELHCLPWYCSSCILYTQVTIGVLTPPAEPFAAVVQKELFIFLSSLGVGLNTRMVKSVQPSITLIAFHALEISLITFIKGREGVGPPYTSVFTLGYSALSSLPMVISGRPGAISVAEDVSQPSLRGSPTISRGRGGGAPSDEPFTILENLDLSPGACVRATNACTIYNPANGLLSQSRWLEHTLRRSWPFDSLVSRVQHLLLPKQTNPPPIG
ncbi:uncharacterized protein EI90DRAFT_3018102 [Cantharellus anzutake]|uniref:uncharacterized protein n=1 Tax=Cantharellus anzutake TaxID=1750568 RepID=UPI001907AA15|nr:uncharacterized protein EI90DRAFT_3018102 [Cantharellus anzutake]KAF8327610.1 hypothetical protein EI90DRAFT_3018102 [Cantharellus anzutake]